MPNEYSLIRAANQGQKGDGKLHGSAIYKRENNRCPYINKSYESIRPRWTSCLFLETFELCKGRCCHKIFIYFERGNLAPLNLTYIALILKVQNFRKVIDFKPISLCNVIYRIIAKTLVNRLKLIMNDIISHTQRSFVPNRLITDNIIIGYECLNKTRQSKDKKEG